MITNPDLFKKLVKEAIRELQQEDALKEAEKELLKPKVVTGEEGKKQFLDHIHAKRRKLEQKRELEEADNVLRQYHERKKKKMRSL